MNRHGSGGGAATTTASSCSWAPFLAECCCKWGLVRMPTPVSPSAAIHTPSINKRRRSAFGILEWGACGYTNGEQRGVSSVV